MKYIYLIILSITYYFDRLLSYWFKKKRIAMQNLDVLMVVGKGLIIFKANSDKGEGGQKLQNLI